MMSEMRYEVVFGARRGLKFATMKEAVDFAWKKAQDIPSGMVVPIWEDGLVVAVVTDDANGLTIQKLERYDDFTG